MRKFDKSYLELSQLQTYQERVEYLMLYGSVAEQTFGGSRYLNQALYRSPEWRQFRQEIIVRDLGCDLGLDGYLIHERPIIHHINPITKEDILNRAPCVFDRNNVILVSKKTHDIIHYAPKLETTQYEFATRRPNDTRLW